jgi:hypothetical protein
MPRPSRARSRTRAFAGSRGWLVHDGHVYADDAVSGADTLKLVNRQRLLDSVRTSLHRFKC